MSHGGIDRDILHNRIVGGEVSVAGAWPWIVQITDKYGQYCSGVIVGNHFVLTAQPCVFNAEPNEIFIVAGAFKVNTPEESRAIYSVSSIHCNEDIYSSEDAICVLHTSEEIQYTNFVQPMCLPDESDVFSEGARCFLAGWGETLTNEEDESRLHELDMPLFSDSHCSKYYQQKNIRSYSPDDHLCAGYFDQRGACTGDAGGPLMCLLGGSPTVAGILSWSEGCRLDSVPAVFSDIHPQLTFIKSVMDDPCLQQPCQNEGVCSVASDGGYKCSCKESYGGPICENDLTDVDDCADSPCQNEGICTDKLGGFDCECSDKFYGPTCAEEISSCSEHINTVALTGPRARYPWSAFLRLAGGSPFCSGTIIGKRHVLTAASCVYNVDSSLISVEYGSEGSSSIVSDAVADVHIHPMYIFYESASRTYDIAIVRLAHDLEYDNYVQPACLPKDADLENGRQCKLNGLGSNGQINEAKVNGVMMDYCKTWNKGEVLDTEFQICTSYAEEPADTCSSGVGGAVWCFGEFNNPEIYGITTFGKQCDEDGTPGVATSVFAFKNWINSHLERDSSSCEGVTKCDPGVCVEATESDKYIVQYPGFVCQGLDACEDGIDQCPIESTCVTDKTVDAGYTCDCGSGYKLEDFECVDIDECADAVCGDMQQCWNTVGSFKCICRTGTENVNGTCVDIDECASEDACGINAECTNIENGGGFDCTCPEGFEGDAYRECKRPPQYCNHPKSENTVKSSVILLGCMPPFKDGTECSTRCTGGKELNTENPKVTCNCIEPDGGCTWDQTEIECVKPTKATTTASTQVGAPTTPKPKAPECQALNTLYSVMPPVHLECDLGAPVNGAKCLIKCNEQGARSSRPEINCRCNGQKCKWAEWKQLRKNEIKCMSLSASSSSSKGNKGDKGSDRGESADPMCPPMPKTLKKYFSKDVDFSCGTTEPFTGTCKASCKNGDKINVPKLSCKCKKSKCKVKELKKIKKVGFGCSGMERTGNRLSFDNAKCPDPYEAYGHHFR